MPKLSLRHFLMAMLFWIIAVETGAAHAATIVPSSRVKSAVMMRVGSSTNTEIIARFVPGDRAELLGDEAGWYRIRLSDGAVGFVSKAWTDLLADAALSEGVVGNVYRVHVIDVGTGLSVFVEGRDFSLLYDAGSQDDLHHDAENRVVAYIKAARPDLTRLDHIILSHPHKDHLQLMPDVFERYAVSNVWDSGRVNQTDGYCHFLKAVAAEPGVQYHDAVASNAVRSVTFSGSGCNGTVYIPQANMMDAKPIALGAGASMTILYRDARNYADPNDNTVVVRLDLGTKRILLAGDAEAGGRETPDKLPQANSIEAKLLLCCAADLKADVLVVGHHGSLTSSRRVFLDAVSASIYAVSSGPYPYKRVRLPDSEIMAELQGRGEVFRTDRTDLFRIEDEALSCELRQRKIGPDADETPGGCDNILITIHGADPMEAEYSGLTD